MNCSAASSSAWTLQLNTAHLKITFLLTLKKLSNFAMMVSYTFPSSADAFVESNTASDSLPIQYSRVLICLLAGSELRPDATRN